MSSFKVNELIVKKLNEIGLTISTCESMTGGAVGANLVLVEHASKCFYGSLVTYATKSKIKLAKVDPELIAEHGTVSIKCAHKMALGAQNAFNTDIGLSVTGNASITNPVEGQPSGMAYICINLFDKVYDYQFNGHYNDRVENINECVAFALNMLWELIKDLKK